MINSVYRILNGEDTLIDGLKSLDKNVNLLMKFSSVNSTDQIKLSDNVGNVKKQPSNVGSQFLILMFIIFGFVAGVLIWKKWSNADDHLSNDGFVKLKEMEEVKVEPKNIPSNDIQVTVSVSTMEKIEI